MNQRLRRALPDALIISLLLVIPLLIFFPQTVGGKTMVPIDNLYQWEPYRTLAAEAGVGQPHNTLLSDLILENTAWKQFARERLFAGEIPLWQPYILAGSPFLAAGQSSMLYPFSILFLIMPVLAAFGWFTVSQLWLAGLNTYLLARVLGLRRPAALIAALTYQLSGFMLASAVFPMIIATAAWLPLELAMIELIIRQQPVAGRPATLPWAAVGALGLGLAALAGHVEALYFTLLVMGFTAAWRLLAGLASRWRESGRWRWLLIRAAWLLVLVAAGLALGAVQIIPAYELARLSFREGAVSLEEVRGWAYPARHVLAFLMPSVFGSPAHHTVFDLFSGRMVPITANAFGEPVSGTSWGIKNAVEGAAYAGILPLLLALIAAWQWAAARLRTLRAQPAEALHAGAEGRGRPYRVIFGTLALLSLSFAFGTPTYALLYYGLPFINQSHAPFRWVWPFTLCAAVLAGFGAETLARAAAQHQKAPGRAIGRAALIGGAAVIGGVIGSRLLYGQIESQVQRLFERLALVASAFPDARTFYSYEAAHALIFGVVLLLAGLVLLLARSGRSVKGVPLWQPLAVLLITADLWAAIAGFYPAINPALLENVPPSIRWLQERQSETDPWRFAVYEEPGRKTMNANMGWLHGLEDISGYDSLIPGQYAAYMQAIMPQGDLPYNRIAPLSTRHPDALDSPLLDLLGVRYVISETPIDNPRYTLAYQDEAVLIYENGAALPRTFTLPYSSTVSYGTEESPGWPSFLETVQQVDVRQHVLIPVPSEPDRPLFERLRADVPAGTPGERGPAAITVNTAEELWIDVEGADSWLVVTGSYFPGWRAWIRPLGGSDDQEQETTVYLVNGNFRGVYLPEGVWTVRLKFSPDSFRFGAFTSFLTAMGLLFALGVWGWRFLYREEGQGAEVRRVAKNTLTPILLNLFNKGILFALTFVSLRVLGPGGAGSYRYAVVIWGWFEILANFGLNTFLTREVARNKDEANRYLVNTTLMRLGLALLGIPLLAGFVLTRQAVTSPPLDSATLWTIAILYAGLFFSTISTGLTALFYAYEKAEYPAAIQTVSAFLTASLGVLVLLLGWGIVGLAFVSLAVNAITLAILGTLALRLFFRPSWSFDWGLQRSALGESFPLMLNHLLATLFFRIAVVLLEALQGEVVVGWYSVVYTWVDAIGIIPAFFTLSLFPVMSRQAGEDRAALKRLYILSIKLMTLLSLPTAIFTTLLAPFLVGVLGGSQYLPHGAIALRIFIWAMTIGWINSVTQYVIIAVNRQRTLTAAFFIAAAFNIAANLIYIPRYSYPATAAIAILSEFVLWGLFYVVILSVLGRVNWLRTLGRIVLAGAVCATATFWLGQVNMWLALLAGLIVYGGVLVLVRPFSAEEWRQLAPALPGPLRGRLAAPTPAAGE